MIRGTDIVLPATGDAAALDLSPDAITVVLDNPNSADMLPIVASLRASLEASIPRTYVGRHQGRAHEARGWIFK